jgi:hypothetical protein
MLTESKRLLAIASLITASSCATAGPVPSEAPLSGPEHAVDVAMVSDYSGLPRALRICSYQYWTCRSKRDPSALEVCAKAPVGTRLKLIEALPPGRSLQVELNLLSKAEVRCYTRLLTCAAPRRARGADRRRRPAVKNGEFVVPPFVAQGRRAAGGGDELDRPALRVLDSRGRSAAACGLRGARARAARVGDGGAGQGPGRGVRAEVAEACRVRRARAGGAREGGHAAVDAPPRLPSRACLPHLRPHLRHLFYLLLRKTAPEILNHLLA